MSFGQTHKITDVCLMVEDIQRTVDFYVDKMGFRLRRRAEGFADFHAANITLAAWEIDHINRHVGVSNVRAPARAHKVCVAVNVSPPAEVDRIHADLSARGVPFYGPPEDYVWNARCIYFTDPDDTLWEVYAWLDGGPGDYHEEHN